MKCVQSCMFVCICTLQVCVCGQWPLLPHLSQVVFPCQRGWVPPPSQGLLMGGVITDLLHSLLHSYLCHFASLNRCPRCQITLTVRLSDQQWAVDWGAGPYIEERAPWCHGVPPGYAGPKQRGMLICCRRQQVCCWLHSLEYASNKFKFKPLK